MPQMSPSDPIAQLATRNSTSPPPAMSAAWIAASAAAQCAAAQSATAAMQRERDRAAGCGTQPRGFSKAPAFARRSAR